MIIDKPLILKYLEGRATPQEEEAFHFWLSDESANLAILREVMAASWSKLPEEPAGEVIREELLSELNRQLYPEFIRLRPRRRVHWYAAAAAKWWYAAAACLFVAGFSVFLLKHRQEPAVVTTAWKTLINNSVTVKYAVLPDSSKVWLHPHSTLAYALSPEDDRRSVRLQGEAFFDVQRDERRPFRVYTGEIATNVLGTAFNVEAYPGEPTIRVSLVQGKVAVEQHILQAGEMMDYYKERHQGVKAGLRIRDMDEWTRGYLILNDLPITYALQRIAGRYNLKVQYDSGVNLSGRRINTIFKKESLEQMLDILLFISRCTYTIKDNTLLISQKSK